MIKRQSVIRVSRTVAIWGAGLLVAGALAAFAAGAGTTRVSVATGGGQGNAWSQGARLSADGQCVAFVSTASNLVSGDTNLKQDIFVHDTATGETTRVNVATDGTQANGDSAGPSLSADGRYVAFLSWASNLVAGDTNKAMDAFVHDRTTGVTTRVSVSSTGAQGVPLLDGSPGTSISANGRYVAFGSAADNLVVGDTNKQWDILVRDRTTGQTSRASVATGGAQGTQANMYPTLSADGRYVVFQGTADDLGGGGAHVKGVFVHDRQTGHTNLVKTDVGALVGTYGNEDPTISGNGRYVAFVSWDSTVVAGDANAKGDIFVYDRTTGVTTRASVATGGTPTNDWSFYPSISADGRYVAFSSYATNLVAGDFNHANDVFIRDRTAGTTTRVSLTNSGTQASLYSDYPSISADGRYVSFDSWASNIVLGDSNAVADVFVRDCGDPAPLVSAWTPKGTGVLTTNNITATFELDMTHASVNNALTINGKAASAFGGAFSWSDKKMIFNPTASLKPNTTYKIAIGTGASVAGGGNMPRAFTWTFKTRATPAPALVTASAAATASGAQVTVNLASAADVTVSIRNLAGREIATLAPGTLEAGMHSLLWNGKSRTGTQVPAGMYLLQVSANATGGSSAQAMTSLQLR
ncbi:MAG: Ig-like domain-containing protein [Armatimonadota bacterium]